MGWRRHGVGRFEDEAFGMGLVGRGQDLLTDSQRLRRAAEADGGRLEQTQAAVKVFVVVPREELAAVYVGHVERREPVGNSGRYLVLNWLSGNGLSLDTCGRLCDLTTSSVANGWASVCDCIAGR